MFPKLPPNLFPHIISPFSSFSSPRFLHQKLKKTINLLVHFEKLHNTQKLFKRDLVRCDGIWTRCAFFWKFSQVRLRENITRILFCDNICCVSKRFCSFLLMTFFRWFFPSQKIETKMLGPLCQTWNVWSFLRFAGRLGRWLRWAWLQLLGFHLREAYVLEWTVSLCVGCKR